MTTLGYALLGLLAREPASGYDLKRQLQAPIGFFWRARHSQIYPELARLEAIGLVTYQVVAQHDLPDKKVYTITAEGRGALRDWVATPAEAPVVRDEVLLKTFSLWLVEPAAAVALVRDQERRHVEQLQVYEGLHQQLVQRAGAALTHWDSPYFASYITLQKGIGAERQYLEWCRWVVLLLEQPA
ncbi:MAG: PadR family transcriptional regulator [Roseiflexaceae bacterium]|nr:PadR family transcriptional regulator [Roseiflexaceae bacterium]